jgi:class 3 adenylate cyclase
VLADTVSAPIIDLRDATRRLGAGDLDVRVPVVSTDETGELAAAFNAMVTGLGVNSGRVVVGTIGGGGRRDFTVIGDPVNTAARVEAATRVTGDDVLITETTLRALGPRGDDFEERPSVPLKGKAATVRLYAPRPDGEPRAQRPRTPS